MTVYNDFADLLTDSVTVEPRLPASDLYGKRTYGPPVTYPCHIMRKRKQIRTADGRDILSDGTVIILGVPGFTPQDRLTVDGFVVNLVAVQPHYDERGPHHTDLIFGAAA